MSNEQIIAALIVFGWWVLCVWAYHAGERDAAIPYMLGWMWPFTLCVGAVFYVLVVLPSKCIDYFKGRFG